jgi:hypothetical protein
MSSKPKAESKAPEPRKPMHGTLPGDKVSGDALLIKCRKPGAWSLYQMSNNHKGHQTMARKNATAIVERGYTNVPSPASPAD